MTAAHTARFLGISLQSVHKQLKVKNLDSQKSQNRIYFGYETSRHMFQLPRKNKTVAFQIVKGGTGKTSVAHSVAIRANLYGARVLVVDLDQQGNMTQACSLDPEKYPCMVDILTGEVSLKDAIVNVSPGLDVLPSRIENAVLDNTIMLKRLPLDRVYRDKLKPLRSKYDLIIIDCPPALGQSVAAATLAADVVVAPVTPEKFCLSGLKITYQEVENLKKVYHRDIALKIVLNKYDTRTTLAGEVLTTLVKNKIYGDLMFRCYLRLSQEFPNAIANGQSIFDTLRETSAKEDTDLLTREILELGTITPEQAASFLGGSSSRKRSSTVV